MISLHVLQKPETIGLINAAAIQQMKDGVILLNTARGKLINEADVAAALNRGKIGATMRAAAAGCTLTCGKSTARPFSSRIGKKRLGN